MQDVQRTEPKRSDETLPRSGNPSDRLFSVGPRVLGPAISLPVSNRPENIAYAFAIK
jgi:hypothetical protein